MQIERIQFDDAQIRGPERAMCLDCIYFYYLLKELKLSAKYRSNFTRTQKSSKFKFILQPTRYNLIDYNWNERVYVLVRERCELDHALSWLSTLGGGFSALGDYFERCALIAGKISVNQFKLALRLGDPSIGSRCYLYLSLSLIQQHKLRLAKRIILHEYQKANNAAVLDVRLIRMCQGIWAKLQYEHNLERIRRAAKCVSLNK